MRTKTLLIAAAALVAGVVSSEAQVYSANIVGYVNVTVPAASYVLMANPLTTGNDVLTNVIPPGSVPNTTTKAYIYSGGSFGGAYTMRAAGWSPSAATVPTAPGDGFFIQNTAATPITITFTGNVLLGTNKLQTTTGYNLIGSQVPVSGLVQTTLGLPAVNTDYVYEWNAALGVGGAYEPKATRHATSWSPAEPNIGTNTLEGVAEGFFYFSSQGPVWTNILNNP